jgi:hypothetical protein
MMMTPAAETRRLRALGSTLKLVPDPVEEGSGGAGDLDAGGLVRSRGMGPGGRPLLGLLQLVAHVGEGHFVQGLLQLGELALFFFDVVSDVLHEPAYSLVEPEVVSRHAVKLGQELLGLKVFLQALLGELVAAGDGLPNGGIEDLLFYGGVDRKLADDLVDDLLLALG